MSALIPTVAATVGPKLAANYGKLLLKYGRLNKAQVAADIATAVNIGRKMARSAKRMKFTQARRHSTKRKRAASAAQRRARKFKKIGNERGSTTSKRHELTADVNHDESLRQVMDTRTLYHEVLNEPNKDSNASAISTRLKDKCFIKGIKFCMEITNNKNDQTYFNYAIIALKNTYVDFPLADVDQLLPIDFFRNFVGDKRACDFNDATLDSND